MHTCNFCQSAPPAQAAAAAARRGMRAAARHVRTAKEAGQLCSTAAALSPHPHVPRHAVRPGGVVDRDEALPARQRGAHEEGGAHEEEGRTQLGPGSAHERLPPLISSPACLLTDSSHPPAPSRHARQALAGANCRVHARAGRYGAHPAASHHCCTAQGVSRGIPSRFISTWACTKAQPDRGQGGEGGPRQQVLRLRPGCAPGRRPLHDGESAPGGYRAWSAWQCRVMREKGRFMC